MKLFSVRQLTLCLTMAVMACSAAVFADHHRSGSHRRSASHHKQPRHRVSSSNSLSSRPCFTKHLVKQLSAEASDCFAGFMFSVDNIGIAWGTAFPVDPVDNAELAGIIAANEANEATSIACLIDSLQQLDVLPADLASIEANLGDYNDAAVAFFLCLNIDNTQPNPTLCNGPASYAAFMAAATSLGQAFANIGCDNSFIPRIQLLASLQGELAQAARGVLVDPARGVSPGDPASEGAAVTDISTEILVLSRVIGSDLAIAAAHCQCKRIR